MKGKKQRIKPGFKLPGEILQAHIKTGKPPCTGYYMCYTDSKEAWTNVFPIARKEVIFHNGTKWMSGMPVLGWIGPLPVLTLDELHTRKPNEAGICAYYIGTPEEAEIFKFKQPMYHQAFSASLSPGKEGEFIYQYNTRKTGLKKLYKYNSDSNKWVKISSKKEMNTNRQPKPKPKPKAVIKSKELDAPIYAVGTKKEASFQNWKRGKKSEFIDAWGGLYNNGEYLWEIRSKSIEPIHVWNHGWANVSPEQSVRIKKMLKIIRYKHAKRKRKA